MIRLLSVAALAVFASIAVAQSYPSRPAANIRVE